MAPARRADVAWRPLVPLTLLGPRTSSGHDHDMQLLYSCIESVLIPRKAASGGWGAQARPGKGLAARPCPSWPFPAKLPQKTQAACPARR